MAAARSKAELRAQAGAAAVAARIARRASARDPSATAAIISPVDGLVAGKVAPPSASTHSPPIQSRVCSVIRGTPRRWTGAAVPAAPVPSSCVNQADHAARPASTHGCHTVGLASIHFCAAASGVIPSWMSSEIPFWSAAVYEKALRNANAAGAFVCSLSLNALYRGSGAYAQLYWLAFSPVAAISLH